MEVKRGDAFWVNFAPSIGGEIKKKKPAVIVSTDRANPYLNRVVVIPLSSRISKIYPSEVKIIFQGREVKAMSDQIRTISKKQLLSKIGTIPFEEMRKIEEKIKMFLELI